MLCALVSPLDKEEWLLATTGESRAPPHPRLDALAEDLRDCLGSGDLNTW
jgi:hypothetical protein